MPELLTIYGSSDYATMEPRKGKKEPDFTEHGIFGLGTDSYLYALDWWYGQYETVKSIEAFIRLAQKWKPQMWWNEGGLIYKAIGPAIQPTAWSTTKKPMRSPGSTALLHART